ncbi:MAG TPA: DNA recombination protein RmuC [Firmicutes bacterium]|jgi:DNA recombination protein RmuC|nr:DNA recombination protein RmuC [Bacillota bacterium]
MSNPYVMALAGFVAGILITYAWMIKRQTSLAAKLSLAEESKVQQEEYLSKVESQFQAAFQNLAQEILESKAVSLTSHNQEQIQTLLEPLRERILEFQDRVEKTHRESMIKIGSLEQVGLTMSAEAQRLTTALKGEVKTQGDWGEMILESILEASGLRAGHEFVLQGEGLELRSESGTKIRPDVVVRLPEKRHLIIDSKVSLVAYERYIKAECPEEQQTQAKELVRSVKAHTDGLRNRFYQGQGSINSPDFVLLFMPLESAYSLALQTDQGLFQYAWDRKVVITTPTTLMATLWIIANIWQQEQQRANALEIARQGGALYDKFVGFVSSLEDLGRLLERSQNAYDQALNQLKTGRGNLISRAESLRSLGLTTSKSLDSKLRDEACQEDDSA